MQTKNPTKAVMSGLEWFGGYCRRDWSVLALGACAWFMVTQTVAASQPKKQATIAQLSWSMMLHSLDWGTRLARDLLLHESTVSLGSVEHRSRVQWNARGIAQFGVAYQHYVDQLQKEFPKQREYWLRWNARIKQLKGVAKILQQDALEEKTDRNWQPLRQNLQSWPSLIAEQPSVDMSIKQQNTVWSAISALSTGIEFTAYHRLRYLSSPSQDATSQASALKGFLRDSSTHRYFFRTLRQLQPKATWVPLFTYHAELFYRSTIFLGRQVLGKPTQRAAAISRYEHYMKTLEQSLAKENSSFASFWRK